MQENIFTEGTVIKGKDLKGHLLCKILSEDMVMRGFQYKLGMNEDENSLSLHGRCEPGLYFCLIQDVCNFLGYGTQIAMVSIPDDENVYVDENKFRTHRLNIDQVLSLDDVNTWKYMVKNGADITAGDNYAIQMASSNGCLEVVKYLASNGADITTDDNIVIQIASAKGHLEMVKHLVANGADVTANNNGAVRLASDNGHLEVVKCLVENGADVTANNNEAIRWASDSGHQEVVEYLQEIMK